MVLNTIFERAQKSQRDTGNVNFLVSLISDTLKLIKNNPKNIFHIIMFDILFLIAIGILYRLTEFLLLKTPTEVSAITITIYLILTLLYYLILILIYSFFKYIVLNSIKSSFKQRNSTNHQIGGMSSARKPPAKLMEFRASKTTKCKANKNMPPVSDRWFLTKTKIDFKQLKKFFLLNLLIFIVFFIAFLILNSVFLTGAKEEYRPYIFLTINLPLFLFLYIFINISHTIFSESLKPTIKETAKKTFTSITKVKNYIGIFLTDTIVILIYFIIFYFIGSILKATLFKSYAASIQYYNIYTIIFTITTIIFFYFIMLFNRIYFYNMTKNKK